MAPGNFMKVLMFLSACSIPLVIFVIVGYGLLMRKNVYEIFVKGAAEGLKTVAAILPTLVGLMAAVGILRASGFLDLFSDICCRIFRFSAGAGAAVNYPHVFFERGYGACAGYL